MRIMEMLAPSSGGFSLPGRLEWVLDRSWEVQPVTWSQLTWWDPLPCGQLLLAHLAATAGPPLLAPSPAVSMRPNPPTPHRRRLLPTHLNFNSSGGGDGGGGYSSSSSPIPFTRRRSVTTIASSSLSSSATMSNCSSLAVPLPPSPDDSFSSVFLPDSPPSSGSSPVEIGADSNMKEFSVAFRHTANLPDSTDGGKSPVGPQRCSSLRSFTANSDSEAMIVRQRQRSGGGGGGGSVSLLPTPPNSEEYNPRRRGGGGVCAVAATAHGQQQQQQLQQRSLSQHKMFSFPAPPPPTLSAGLLPVPPPLLSRPPPYLH